MMRRFAFTAIGIVLLFGALLWIANYMVHAPLAVDESGYIFEVERGSTLRSVTNQLADDDVLRFPRALRA